MHLSQKMSRALKIGGATVGVAAVALGAVFGGRAAFANSVAPMKGHQIKVHPTVQQVTKDPNAVHFTCQDRPIDGSQGPKCYQPGQIQAAYGITPLLNQGITGAGRTIVIVDAYSNPYIPLDLSIFDSTFGLPAANYSHIAPYGVPTFDINDDNQVGWAEEITLDVLWAHAVAPDAHIVLASAASNNDIDIYNTTKYVIDHNVGDVLSQSFGEAETCVDPQLMQKQHAMFEEAAAKGITAFASSGDSGASQFNCDGTAAILAASSPASDPLVTGVGGTTLDADGTTGKYVGETTWTEQLFGCNPPAVSGTDINCSGGGFSTIYGRPTYQAGLQQMQKKERGVPDVAYNAGVNGGVLTHCAVCNITVGLTPDSPTFFLFGGTSAGSPQWAGIAALGDQLAGHRLGFINKGLYTVSRAKPKYAAAFHDVTIGNNDVSEIGTGYDAGVHWDPVTGLGTPNAANLLPLLIKTL